MRLVSTNIKLRREYLAIAKEYNEAPAGSAEERDADRKAAGFRIAVKALGEDWGTILMDADAAAIETYGEVPMVGGFLLK